MNKVWTDRAWDEYLEWQTHDKKTLKKINELIKSIERCGISDGIGHPEPLKYRPKCWSREINRKDRLVYYIEDGLIYIVSCKGHYDDK